MKLKHRELFSTIFHILVAIVSSGEASNVNDERIKPLSRGTGEGFAYANFKPQKFSYLNVTSIGSDYVLEDSECGFVCANTPSCFSFNLGVFSAFMGKVLCELLPSDVFNNSDKFVYSQSHHHYSITSPCISWPCRNNGTCAAQYEDNSYVCICKKGFKGKDCEFDIDECAEGLHSCDVHAYCNNTAGSYTCTCKPTYHGNGEICILGAKNCAQLYNAGVRSNGVYLIDPDGSGDFHVYCDQTTSGGGWTVFQKRLDGSVDFYRTWYSYKYGFGNTTSEFWLGLESIHRLTNSEGYKLRIDLEDFSGDTVYAEYTWFKVESEGSNYTLRFGSYSGNAGDSFSFHKGRSFTTRDRDNDLMRGMNCGELCKGGWWYNECWHSNLNGYYHRGTYPRENGWYNGVGWYKWKGHNYSLKRTEMKMRPVGF